MSALLQDTHQLPLTNLLNVLVQIVNKRDPEGVSDKVHPEHLHDISGSYSDIRSTEKCRRFALRPLKCLSEGFCPELGKVCDNKYTCMIKRCVKIEHHVKNI
jgi:hypothetical protein